MNKNASKLYGWKSGTWVAEPYVKCRFDVEVERLGITEAEFRQSAELKQWVDKNKNDYYVPEYLLDFWGFIVDLGREFSTEKPYKGRIRLPEFRGEDRLEDLRYPEEVSGNKELSKY
jgi:hypothetical protein